MDELIERIQERTGIPEDKAREAADAAVGFIKERLPEPIAAKLDDFIAGNADSMADFAGEAMDKVKGMFGGGGAG